MPTGARSASAPGACATGTASETAAAERRVRMETVLIVGWLVAKSFGCTKGVK